MDHELVVFYALNINKITKFEINQKKKRITAATSARNGDKMEISVHV